MPNTLAVPSAGKRQNLAEVSIAVVAGLGLTAAALFLCAVPLSGHMAGSRDFVSYWATGQQLVHHANPYDRAAVGRIEHAAGLDVRAILIMRNPPWALPLAWPLGFLGLRIAALLWSLLLLGCLFTSVQIVRGLHGSPPNPIHWLGLGFTPALICLTMGQTALLALLGLALFLRFHKERPFVAGVALWLCALKPHLFLPVGVALLAWIVFTRAWRVMAGAAAALAATSALAWVIAPHAWTDYAQMLRSPLVESQFIPCLADALHHWIWPQLTWTQYAPAAVASVWALAYFWRRRAEWDWVKNGGTLMLVSILLAPYAWLYDQCLVLPALLHAAYGNRRNGMLIALSLMIFVADMELGAVKVVSPLWLWTAPAWLGWYLAAGMKNWPAAKADIDGEAICQTDN